MSKDPESRKASRNVPILRGHALNTSTDTDIDHTRVDGVGNVNNSLQTTGALTVQTLDGCSLGETSHESSSTELGGTATRGKDGTDGNIIDELGVNSTALDDALEDTGEQIRSGSVLEATLTTLGEGSTQGTSHNNIIGVLLGDGGDTLLAARAEVGGDLSETLLGYRRSVRLHSAPVISKSGGLPEDMMVMV